MEVGGGKKKGEEEAERKEEKEKTHVTVVMLPHPRLQLQRNQQWRREDVFGVQCWWGRVWMLWKGVLPPSVTPLTSIKPRANSSKTITTASSTCNQNLMFSRSLLPPHPPPPASSPSSVPTYLPAYFPPSLFRYLPPFPLRLDNW